MTHKAKTQPEILVFSTRALKKLLLSSFVVGTFVAYAVRERLNGADAGTVVTSVPLSAVPSANASASTSPSSVSAPSANSSSQSSSASQPANSLPPSSLSSAPVPSATPVPQPHHLYQDGQFAGVVADAYWGNVQVEAVIQDGKITDVQFLDYPQDRRTSRFINSQAVPWLHDEAIQAQSANVNIISGATLTSEAFIQSLQTALDKARNQA